jgi:hypothetical protein
MCRFSTLSAQAFLGAVLVFQAHSMHTHIVTGAISQSLRPNSPTKSRLILTSSSTSPSSGCFLPPIHAHFSLSSMSAIGPPGGASVICEEIVCAVAIGVKQPSDEEREQTRVREQHATMLAVQQEHAAHVAEVRRLREAHLQQQQDVLENARIRDESLRDYKKLLIKWLSTDVVDACDEKYLVESMRRQGVAQPITFMCVTKDSPHAFRLPGVSLEELMMHLDTLRSYTHGEVIVDRPGHVLHECKLRLSVSRTYMHIEVLADKIYKAVPVTQPKSCCAVQ